MARYLSQPNEVVFTTPATLQGARFYALAYLARVDRLQAWCNRYLNLPGSPVRFRPFEVLGQGFVMATFVDIGHATPADPSIGWTREKDLAFWLPLQERDDQAVPTWAVPFLYVDQPHGVAMGREIYGLPKCPASFTLSPPADWPDLMEARVWAPDPITAEWTGGHSLMSLRKPSLTATVADLISALVRDGNVEVDGESRSARGLFSGVEDPAQVLERIGRIFDEVMGFLQNPAVSLVLLKQFRSAQEPEHACYQSLLRARATLSRLDVDAVPRLYRHRLQDLDTHPIPPVLGLLAGLPFMEVRRLSCDFTLELGVEFWRNGQPV